MTLLHDLTRRESNIIVLDVDGTLVDSNDAHARAWVDAFTEAGILVDHDQVRRAIGMGGDKLMPHVSGIAEDSPDGTRISERRGEIFTSRYLPHIQPFPRARELVQRFLDDGFAVVVASSAKEDELDALLHRADVADLIASQTSSDDAEHSKPDPDIVSAALARAGWSGGVAVMLGDTPYDVEAALRAGIGIVAVESGGWRRGELGGAIEVYADTADLCERYEQSVFGRLRSTYDRRLTSAVRTNRDLIALLAAGVAGVALIAIVIRVFGRGQRRDHDDELTERRPGLSARDRARLRRIIERTS